MSFSSSTNRVTTSGFSYDAAGNMLADGTGAGTFGFEWDAEGRMKQATDNASSTVTTFVYNALGQRVQKTVGASVLNTAFDAFGQEIGWHTGSYWAQYFVPMPGGSTPLAKYEDGTVHFLHRDALGSTRFLTNHFGTVRQDAIYYPWGQMWEWRTALFDARFASLGLRRGYGAGDVEGVDDHTQFRFYGSRLYRWLSPDPLAGSIMNPQSLNRYAYVMNDPTNLIDPSGLGCESQTSVPYDVCMAHYAGTSFETFANWATQAFPVFAVDEIVGGWTQAQHPIWIPGGGGSVGGWGGGILNLPPLSSGGGLPCDWYCGGTPAANFQDASTIANEVPFVITVVSICPGCLVAPAIVAGAAVATASFVLPGYYAGKWLEKRILPKPVPPPPVALPRGVPDLGGIETCTLITMGEHPSGGLGCVYKCPSGFPLWTRPNPDGYCERFARHGTTIK